MTVWLAEGDGCVVKDEQQKAEFEALFRREYDALCRYVYCIVRSADDTAEIVQESFLRVWQLQQQGEKGCNDPGLLFRIARNFALDSLRSQRVRLKYADTLARGTPLAAPPTPEELTIDSEIESLTEAMLGRLSGKQRACVTLRRRGFSYGEIAAALGLVPTSVGPLLSRALRRLRTMYEEYFPMESGVLGDT